MRCCFCNIVWHFYHTFVKMSERRWIATLDSGRSVYWEDDINNVTALFPKPLYSKTISPLIKLLLVNKVSIITCATFHGDNFIKIYSFTLSVSPSLCYSELSFFNLIYDFILVLFHIIYIIKCFLSWTTSFSMLLRYSTATAFVWRNSFVITSQLHISINNIIDE